MGDLGGSVRPYCFQYCVGLDFFPGIPLLTSYCSLLKGGGQSPASLGVRMLKIRRGTEIACLDAKLPSRLHITIAVESDVKPQERTITLELTVLI